jgi:HAD superfamily hydrolase (TIGR01509 family)
MPGAFSSKRNLLFDLDGTLVDSSPLHARAFVATLAPVDARLAGRFDYAAVAGLPTRDTFIRLGFTQEPQLAELISRKQALYREALDRGELGAFPGMRELIAELFAERRALFLVTGASRISAQRILETLKLSDFFSLLITAEDVPAGKPSPAPYRVALATCALDPAQSLAIEDGAHGVASARAAGLDVVTIHGEKGFPDIPHARDFADLRELLLP